MRAGIDYGREHLEIEVAENSVVKVRRETAAPALADPTTALRQALEEPLGFPALRQALTPDDKVAVALNDELPLMPGLLLPLLDHLLQAGLAAEAITLVQPPGGSFALWNQPLPETYRNVRQEIHDPQNRKVLSYLAATRQGRRIYLNRTVVEADQVVVVSRRGYDPLLGYAGAAGDLFPALADEDVRKELCVELTTSPPGTTPWPIQEEAAEVAWLLGAPFLVQVIEGAGEEVAHVLGGLIESSAEGQRLLDARWRVEVDRSAEVVIAALAGDPSRHGFADLARALACAARVVKPDGRIVLLTQAQPEPGAGMEMIRRLGDPEQALRILREQKPPDMATAFQWASAVQQAKVYLLSGLPEEMAEELFTIPLENAGQVQRLTAKAESCLLLPDAHKTLALRAEMAES